MSAALRELWFRAGVEEPVFSSDETRCWAKPEFNQLLSLGLLRETSQAQGVLCDCMEAHWEEVFWAPDVREPSGTRAYIACPVESVVVHVNPERLRRWAVDPQALASVLAGSLKLSGLIEPLPGGRQWALGRRHMAGRFREFFLASIEEGQLDNRIMDSPAPVVLVPYRYRNGGSTRLPMFSLSSVTTLADGGLILDLAYIEDALPAERSSTKAKAVQSFQVPEDARWEELALEIRDATVVMSIRNSWQELSLEECGLTDERQEGSTGDRALQTLRVLARHNGVFTSNEASGHEGTPFRSQISNLRKRLQAKFPIEGNPILYHGKARCYRCAFQVRLGADAGFATPYGSTWADFQFSEIAGGIILVSVKSKELFRAFGQKNDRAGRPSIEAAERDGLISREYRLVALGLADPTGRAMPEGQALLDFLRQSGKLVRRPDDIAVLRLAKQLQAWTGLDSSPFQYSPTTKRWIANFECSSVRGGKQAMIAPRCTSTSTLL
ncbi:MAG: hypothetical protein HY820_04520 [Acidobacteria bacterium]|nr:hypothetical protein [Acidobacteriota bacterium]